MCDQNSNILNGRNNEFDSKDYYTDTLLDLHVDAPKYSNSNNDDEFDLEEIKREALTNFEDTESTDPINDFPEIDLRVPSEGTGKFSENKISTEENKGNTHIEVDITSNVVTNLNKGETIQSNTETTREVVIHRNSLSTNLEKCDVIDKELNELLLNQTNTCTEETLKNLKELNNKNKTDDKLACNWENESIPSPFIMSFTPPPLSLTEIMLPFKRENSVEISDNYFDSDYFEDNNLDNFQQEEICTDEFDVLYDVENIDEIETVDCIPNENSNEKIFYQQSVEDVIMNDHNYFNQEQNLLSVESYIKHSNILNNNLNIFIKNLKNYYEVPELFEKQKSDIEGKLKEIFDKVHMLKNTFSSIKKPESDVVLQDQNLVLQDQNLVLPDDKLKDRICENENKHAGEMLNQFDSALLEALKNVENCNDTIALSESSQIETKSGNNEEILHENDDNFISLLGNLKNDFASKNTKTCTKNEETEHLNGNVNQKQLVYENNLNDDVCKKNNKTLLESENVNASKFIQDNENFSEEKPWTKYKTLLELAKTIIEFSQNSNNNEIEKFFEESKMNMWQIMSCPNLSDVGVQTEHSGKIYSERRLKSINEKEKHRLLNDSSNSSEDSSEYETDNESSLKYESQSENNLNKEEQENILNGIDFSKYLDSSNEDSDNFPNDFSEHLDVVLEEEDDILQKINKESQEIDSKVIVDNENKARGIALAKKLNKVVENCGSVSSDNIDKDIDRLLDFKTLASQRINLNCGYTNTDRKSANKKTMAADISNILLEEENKDSSDGTETEDDDCLTNENTFLSRQNENVKKQLLESSCSESENESGVISPDDIDDENEDFDSTKPTLVEKFLKTYVESECEPEKVNNNSNEKHYSDLDQAPVKQNILDANERKSNESRKSNDLENKENDIPDEDSDKHNASSDCEFLDKTYISLKQSNKKRKSLDTLLDEDQKRRKNLKINDEIYSLSSDDDESDVEERRTKKTEPHRITRPIMKTEQLTSETKKAQKEEKNRLNRLKKKENILKKAYKEHNKDPSDIRELILDYNTKTKSFITVHNGLVSHLKQHQIDGVKFMYDCCYGSVNFVDEFPGSGCILAHCMGLGKTLQLITLIHTLIIHKELKTTRVLILCPKSTVMNWAEEIQRWLGPLGVKNMKVFTFNDTSDIPEKMNVLQEWHSCGSSGSHNSGCLLIGYEAFRTLVSYPSKKNRNSRLDLEEIKSVVKKALLDPGADLVVCDEGHIIKNRKAAISQAVTEIKTSRRIVLTGTPIQNNLKEYYSMVNFIKPSFLGTEKEFANLYANPIKNGQHKDSSKREIKIMKQRSFVLHSNLSSFVQRKEAALLKTFLPQKFEYVLFIPMTPVQAKLYEIFLEAVAKREDSEKKGRNLLTDYTCLRKIWTHPKVLENAYNNAILSKNKKEKRSNNLEVASDEDQPDDIYDSQTGLMSVTSDWWRKHLTDQDLTSIVPSNKLQTMFEILRMCTENREKWLKTFVAVLNVVEYFMNLINERKPETTKELGIDRFKGPWVNGKDYYRLDGKTQKTLRHEMVKRFNDPTNERARVFLISAKAGGQGINLIGANRVIILDTSWNPSNDQQNIFRIFRLGQKKNCYIYRLISFGTMEEKVYSRSVTKQAMSFRVVDEHQIDRHYSMAELGELYTLTKPDYSNRPIPNLPQDNILAHLLRNYQYVFKYHEHDSLLENKIEQELTEQEKEDAWLAYENEINTPANAPFPNLHGLDIFGNQQLGISGFDNFPRSPPSTDMFNQGRVPVTSAQFFPGYNFANKNYLDMFPFFSNTNSLYGGIDLSKNASYADSLNTNFLLPNNRPTGNTLGLTDLPPTSSPSYSSLDNLHIPSSHPNTFNQNLTSYNTLYSNANTLLNNSLNRFNNTSLENFKRVFENYVSSSSNMSNIYTSNQNKNQFNSELRAKTADMTNATSKNEMNSFRKHNLHPNFTASLATSSTGSMTNSILNAQNRLINQSSNNDLNTALKTNSPTTVSNVQNDSKVQQTTETSQFDKTIIGSNSNSSTLVHTHLSNTPNNQSRSNNKINFSDNKKTDTLKNVTLDVLKNDNALLSRRSPKSSVDESGNKSKQISIQKTNMVKNLSTQNVQIPGFATKSTTQNEPTTKSQSISVLQNNNLSKSSFNVLKRPTNLIKNNGPTKQSVSNSVSAEQNNLNTFRGKTNSPTTSDITISKNMDLQNITRNKPNNIPLPLSSKNTSTVKKSLPLQFNQDTQKGQNSISTTASIFPKTNKFLIDPLSSAVEDKLLNAGISISKKPANPKPIANVTGLNNKQQNQTVPTQLQSGIFKRKKVLGPESIIRGGPSVPNKVDSILKKPKLTPKELAEELSSSLKRIQSSKGLTISHKGVTKGTHLSADILEVD